MYTYAEICRNSAWLIPRTACSHCGTETNSHVFFLGHQNVWHSLGQLLYLTFNWCQMVTKTEGCQHEHCTPKEWFSIILWPNITSFTSCYRLAIAGCGEDCAGNYKGPVGWTSILRGLLSSNLWLSNVDMNTHVTYWIILLQRISIWPILRLGYSFNFTSLLTLRPASQREGTGCMSTAWRRHSGHLVHPLVHRHPKPAFPFCQNGHLLTWRHSQAQIMQKHYFDQLTDDQLLRTSSEVGK